MAQFRRYNRQDEETQDVEFDEIAKAAAEAVDQHAKGTSGYDTRTKAEKEAAVEAPSQARRVLVILAVVLASLIMIISILLPSLSAIIEAFTSSSSDDTEVEVVDATTEDEDSSDSMSDYIDTIDERYTTLADNLKSKVESNAEDKASLINLANTYYEWGTSVNNFASSDEQKAHVTELMQNAITYYDQYLALDDASAAHVNRALCQYYAGDTDGALASLVDFCNRVPDYAPAWSNLGMIYSAAGDTENALTAYNKVLEVDPEDTYGLATTAENQISTLSSTAEDATEGAAEATTE